MSWLARISSNVQELRIILCPVGEGSAGVRYEWIKAVNPRLPICVRQAETAHASLFCRYDFNKEKSADIEFVSAEDIEQTIKEFVEAGENMPKSAESIWGEDYVTHAKERGGTPF